MLFILYLFNFVRLRTVPSEKNFVMFHSLDENVVMHKFIYVLFSSCCNKTDFLSLFNSVIAVDLKQTIQVDKDLQIRAYYAGHVSFITLFIISLVDTLSIQSFYSLCLDRSEKFRL